MPGFNTMSLFRVPAPHRVAVVAADATGTRLSITGWFRRGAEPAVGDGP
jgi:Rps23 Pro-64 3,4-dihydroxylase Tpa1-like proline 4-hydroxylase